MYEELVKRLREVADEVDSDYDVDPYNAEQRCLAILQAADAIEELSKPKWIPVTERLPEENGNYLVSVKCPRGKWVEICACDGRDLVSVDEYTEYATKWVTHWMPLPQPPMEG